MAGVYIQTEDGKDLQAAVISSSSGTITAIAAVTGSLIRVYKIFLVVTGATNITFEDGSTALSGAMALAANGSITLSMDGQPWFTCAGAFTIVNSATTQVSGTVYYTTTPFR